MTYEKSNTTLKMIGQTKAASWPEQITRLPCLAVFATLMVLIFELKNVQLNIEYKQIIQQLC